MPHPHLEDRKGSEPRDVHKMHKQSLSFNEEMVVLAAALLGSPWTVYVFCTLALLALPALLVSISILPASLFPSAILSTSFVALVAWVAQTFIQLVALAILQAYGVIGGKKTDLMMKEMYRTSKLAYKDSEVLLKLTDEMHALLKLNNQLTAEIHSSLKKPVAKKNRVIKLKEKLTI